MSDTRTSFNYSPIRQGYDTNSWRTLLGAPALGSGGRLTVDTDSQAGSAIHYADFFKGDIKFNVTIPSAPGSGTANRIFGLSLPNSQEYIRFAIDEVLTCEVSNGTTSSSTEVTWDSDWTGNSIEFAIRWEAGQVRFFINGGRVVTVSDSSVPYGPLSLYLFDDSASAMTVGDITVQGAQLYVKHPATSDLSTFRGDVIATQLVTVSEGVTIKIPTLVPSVFESVTVTEDTGALNLSIKKPFIFDTVTVTENIALTVV